MLCSHDEENDGLYRAVLERLHQLVPNFAPTQLIADFEDAPAAAFRTVFGDQLAISGCWFHYAQAVIRRMKKLGLQEAYKTQEQSQLAFRCILSLPLLPVSDIEPGFGDLKTLDIDDAASKQLMQQLLRYVDRQWLKKASIGPTRLSVRDNTSRTNNAMESFHAALRQRVKVAHPNLYTFLGHLQRMTTDQQTEIERVNRGLTIRRAKKKSYVINDARIRTCINR